MNTEADFLAAVAASPNDELLLTGFADWLEERGDPRAPWVRSPEVRAWMGPRFECPIPAMIQQLKKKRRVMAVRRSAGAVGLAMVPALVELLKDGTPFVRFQALHCLRAIKGGPAEASPALIEALKDDDPLVRGQAALALKAALNNVAPLVRAQAALALEAAAKKGIDTGAL